MASIVNYAFVSHSDKRQKLWHITLSERFQQARYALARHERSLGYVSPNVVDVDEPPQVQARCRCTACRQGVAAGLLHDRV